MNPKESYQISDELWAKIQPLLPTHVNTHRLGGGRPRAEDRQCLNGILFVLLPMERSGCHRPLSQQHGPRPVSGMGEGGRLPPLVGGRTAGI